MDFKLLENRNTFDFEIDEYGRVSDGMDVETAVYISIFTDRRSVEGDEVLDGDYKGWWGDSFAEYNIGSRLWTLKREKATLLVLKKAKHIIVEALQWLIDDGVASTVSVYNEWSRYNLGAMNMAVEIEKPDGSTLEFKYEEQWSL